MNKFIYILILFLFSPSLTYSESDEKETEIQKQQRLLVEHLDSQIEISEVKWTNSNTIDVTYSSSYLERLTKNEIEKKANIIAKMGFIAIKNEACANITNQRGNEEAYKCYGAIPNELNEKQKLLAQEVEQYSSIMSAHWTNPYTLDVTYKNSYLEFLTEDDLQTDAQRISKLGFLILKKETCVKASDYEGNELAYQCHGNKAL